MPQDQHNHQNDTTSPWTGGNDRVPPFSAGWIPQRLRDGRPTLADQLRFRLSGMIALTGFALFMHWLCQLQVSDPQQAASPLMLLACLGAVILMHIGTALTLIGPDLLHTVDYPVRRFRI